MQAQLHRRAITALTAITGLLMLAGSAGAQPNLVGDSVLPPLWGPLDPGQFPVDFTGVYPLYEDESARLPWGPGGILEEPSPNSFNAITRRISMANAASSSRHKLLWLRLTWLPGPNSIPPPEFQPVGEPINESLWPSAMARDSQGNPTGSGSLTGVGYETTTVGTVVLTMTFRFHPQPARETVDLAPLITAGTLPYRIEVQTICIPAPAAATFLLGVGLVASRRRRT